jgi:hypothetical protein
VALPLRTLGHVEQRRPREKRKELTVALSSRGRRHLGFARRAAVGVSSLSLRRREEKREVGEESKLGFDGERPAQGFCSTGNRTQSSDQNERSMSIGL